MFFPPTVATICKERPVMCAKLNPDGWCRAEKAEVIKHRYQHKDDPDEHHKYDLLLKFEEYEACISKAAQIRHIKYREKESGRMDGLLTAQSEIKRLSKETRESNDPYLAYYQWSRYGHEDALKRFLAHARAGNLNTPRLQIALASIQFKQDWNLTRDTLYKALSLYESGDDIDSEVFISLTTIALQKENYSMAVVWTLVAAEYEAEIDETRLNSLQAAQELPMATLEAIADEIIDAVDNGEFDAVKLGIQNQ